MPIFYCFLTAKLQKKRESPNLYIMIAKINASINYFLSFAYFSANFWLFNGEIGKFTVNFPILFFFLKKIYYFCSHDRRCTAY